ncbi:MAG: sugar transferase [Akkermansia sp.]|nr:sugar transferase [Akkermansia sp.]
MLIQNTDRTTYGINKISVALTAFLFFFLASIVSYEKYMSNLEAICIISTPAIYMGLMLYFCCDQFGVYFRCTTLAKSLRRYIYAYFVFILLTSPSWLYFDIWALALAYLLTFITVMLARTACFRREKMLVEEAPTLLIGTKEHIATFKTQLIENNTNYDHFIIELEPEQVHTESTRNILIEKSIHRVVVIPEGISVDVIQCIVDLCGKMGVDFYAPMPISMKAPHKTYFGVLGGARMLVYKSTPIPYTTSWQLKKLIDRVGAITLLICTSPLWLIAAIGIKISSKGPIFFRQKRSGIYGKEFGMWKFRTMYPDADKRLDEVKAKFGNDMSGPIFKLENDPRIFPLGRILRKFSIDELPQLLNVLSGDMSLVGPRPLPIYETAAFTSDEHRRRLSVLPGVTGYWQIAGRSDITDFNELVNLDMYYIDHWSLWLDIKLLLKTVPAVLFAKGAK